MHFPGSSSLSWNPTQSGENYLIQVALISAVFRWSSKLKQAGTTRWHKGQNFSLQSPPPSFSFVTCFKKKKKVKKARGGNERENVCERERDWLFAAAAAASCYPCLPVHGQGSQHPLLRCCCRVRSGSRADQRAATQLGPQLYICSEEIAKGCWTPPNPVSGVKVQTFCPSSRPAGTRSVGKPHGGEWGHGLLSLQQLLWGTQLSRFPFGFLNFIKGGHVAKCLNRATAPSKCSEKLVLHLNSLTLYFCLHSKHLDSHHPFPARGSQAEVLL